MSDGIIQKTIDYYRSYPLDRNLLDMLEQRLIGEIKNNSSFLTEYRTRALSLRQLIGDNQE